MRVKNEPLSKRTRGAKCMVMATGKRAVDEVLSAKSDPTVRSFASEDAAASHHAQQAQQSEELSEWGVGQDATHRFCRFEACTWQSFGTRPSSTTPHGFEARSLMLKLAQDPAIVHIMREREYRVGLLAELDPIDDRLSEKLEDGGKRLLGYNTNAGASIHIRLRTHDLSGFLAYPALIDTLLHELAHNEVGPHNEQFWHLFCLRHEAVRGDRHSPHWILVYVGVAGEPFLTQLLQRRGEARALKAAPSWPDNSARLVNAICSTHDERVTVAEFRIAGGPALNREHLHVRNCCCLWHGRS